MNWEAKFKAVISGKRKGFVGSFCRGTLWLGSFLYAIGIRYRNWRFDRGKNVQRADIPVISVGNLTTGGTGKTPLVCYIAERLRSMDMRVTILSRGYGSSDGFVNDEALELELRLPDVPHLQDSNRKKIADIASKELDAEVLLLDDGFQHRQLKRDVDIVVVDATNPFGFGYLLPRGLLREPLSSFARADVVVINRCNLVSPECVAAIKSRIREQHAKVPVALVNTVVTHLADAAGNEYLAEDFENEKVIAFCGIGNPDGFRETLNDLKVEVADFREFPDHHAYSREDIADLNDWSSQFPECTTVLCTHKDLVKVRLPKIGRLNLRAVVISSKFSQREKRFWSTIHTRMQQPPT